MENSERLSEAVEQAKLEQQVVIEKLNSKLKEYQQLDDLLSTFTDKRVHEAMIPISKSKGHWLIETHDSVQLPFAQEDL